MPTGYLPDEDQGSLLIMGQLPSGSTLEQTNAVMSRVQDHFRDNEKEAVEASTRKLVEGDVLAIWPPIAGG